MILAIKKNPASIPLIFAPFSCWYINAIGGPLIVEMVFIKPAIQPTSKRVREFTLILAPNKLRMTAIRIKQPNSRLNFEEGIRLIKARAGTVPMAKPMIDVHNPENSIADRSRKVIRGLRRIKAHNKGPGTYWELIKTNNGAAKRAEPNPTDPWIKAEKARIRKTRIYWMNGTAGNYFLLTDRSQGKIEDENLIC